ncbi:MAG: hypothetical protein AAGF25_11310, partial [Pseudomonadota bacterium]
HNSDSASEALEVMMLAPWVVAMRMPNLIYEVATPWHASGGRRGGEGEKAVVEKTAAVVESFGVVQAEMLSSWSAIMTSAMLGELPDVAKLSRSMQDITDAGMKPMAKRVRANYARLKKRAA